MASSGADLQEPPVRSLRSTLVEKLTRSGRAWRWSVFRFRALHWTCLFGVIVLPITLSTFKDYLSPLEATVISAVIAFFGSVQAIVKPYDKFTRDIEFRDEADFFCRQALATTDPAAIAKIMNDFEQVERRFHQGQHPWPVLKRGGRGSEEDERDATI